jgi:threonylcarbamoyladenosine tRNA methylthiotransferase MtaB
LSGLAFHTITLGCKLNQFDSAVIEGELLRRGYRPIATVAGAAVVVVNTCTVTHKADAEARRLIRGVRRRNPDCKLLVTGCYAVADATALRSIEGVDVVFGNRDKRRLGAILDDLGIEGGEACPSTAPAPHFGGKSRALLKVQEGCRLVCSYCVVPQVRGPSRSVQPLEVERAALGMFASGYREIVLTGINTGDYGLDLDPPTDLETLLRRLLSSCGPNRIRLNSLEPLSVTDGIIDLMSSDPRLAPHLQIPLQSGSDAVLQRMRRNYRSRDYRGLLRRLRKAIPHIGLGADVIVGFPGETDEEFRQTHELIADSPLNYLHVFAWSPRKGTAAAGLPDRVPGPVIKQRSARLRGLGELLSLRFRKSFEGRRLDAVVLGRSKALTGNYIEVVLEERAASPGDLVGIRIRHVTEEGALAVVEEPPSWARA